MPREVHFYGGDSDAAFDFYFDRDDLKRFDRDQYGNTVFLNKPLGTVQQWDLYVLGRRKNCFIGYRYRIQDANALYHVGRHLDGSERLEDILPAVQPYLDRGVPVQAHLDPAPTHTEATIPEQLLDLVRDPWRLAVQPAFRRWRERVHTFYTDKILNPGT